KVYKNYSVEFPEQHIVFTPEKEFTQTAHFDFPLERFRNRFYVEVKFDKKLIDPNEDWKDILVVFDATNSTTGERNYFTSPVYTYYKEAQDDWESTTVQDEVLVEFNPMEKMIIYFWNPYKKNAAIKNIDI